ncbi:hypothetical protein [Streptomyces chartreusis]|uniref:hypothetical protein n=1 Tax=Streptomyces chartreusis TaxID=1969 RepID=UPI0037DD2692|nr:hypothetical protein OG938_48440 [Streptomyces chartreusis]
MLQPTMQELFNGDAVALTDPDLDQFTAKGHHGVDELAQLLRAGEHVPADFRDYRVTPGTVRHTWTLFAWHRPGCDAAGEDAPWCQCGLDEAGARVDWYPAPADQSTPGAIPVTWFNARK